MKHEAEYDQLARLTGLPNLAGVNDPERLERLVAGAWSSLSHASSRMPLRCRVAYTRYAEAALERLENPEAAL